MCRPGRIAQLLRYSAVSGVSTVTSLTVLGALVGIFGVDAALANVLATAVGTVPSFELNRRWVWFDHSQRSVVRQVTPFCALTFAGLVISTLTVRAVSARTVDLGRGWHTVAVEAANAAAYGAVWVVQFVLKDRVLFRQRPTPDAGATDTASPATGLELACRSQATTPASRRSANSSAPRPNSAARTSSVCSPSQGTRVSGPSVTSANLTGSPGISTGWATPSGRGCSTSM
jgi:putative flippase GtrA